jgi:nucleotide-binding universal stress UspA family protein
MGEGAMTLKNIGVFVDATPEGEKRIDYAATLAHQCSAHLAGIHVISAVRPEYRSDYYVIGEKAIRAMLAERKTADEAATSNVRRRFEAISAKRDLSAEFRVIRRGEPDEDLTLNSLHSDLVVIGQRELQELRGYASPEKLLLASGSPVLVIPSGWKAEEGPQPHPGVARSPVHEETGPTAVRQKECGHSGSGCVGGHGAAPCW